MPAGSTVDEIRNAHDEYGNVVVIADGESGWVVHGGDEHEVVELEEGLSIIGNRDVNDPRDESVKLARRLLTLQSLDSPVTFLAVASKVFARAPSPPGPRSERPGSPWQGPSSSR